MDQWSDFFDDDTINLLNSIVENIDRSGQDIRPQRDEVLEIFALIAPKKIKAIIIGQSPYPNDEACGIPFVSKSDNVTMSLKILKKEIEMEYGSVKDPNRMVKSWVEQGVFIINSSPTIGLDGKEYLRDHSIIWREFLIKLMRYIGKETIPILLFGKDAWSFEDHVNSACVLKVPHPVSRGENKFLGCMVFTNTNKFLRGMSLGEVMWAF